MRIIKEWEYVIKSLKKIKPPERAVDLAESIQEQLEIYDLNRNTYEWKHGGYQLIVGDLYDLGGVLESGSHYCYSCISYQLIVMYVQLTLQALKNVVKSYGINTYCIRVRLSKG